MSILTATIGYRRIGKNREVKKALDSFWRDKITAESLIKTVTEVEAHHWQTQLNPGIANLPLEQVWVNPDCGLKTRLWQEVIPALKNMVVATQQLREDSHEK